MSLAWIAPTVSCVLRSENFSTAQAFALFNLSRQLGLRGLLYRAMPQPLRARGQRSLAPAVT
jgi:hypothetical protein